MRRQIFTVLAILGGLVCANAADVNVSHGEDLAAKILSAGGSGTVRVEVGTYVLDAELTIPAGVIVVGGYPSGSFDDGDRIYPGAATDKTEMTILDGNSLVNTVPSDKHRVATVAGTLEGVMIRNGHARGNSGAAAHGGGVYVDGGTVQNCIIKGNVAMDPITNEALGGGAYLNGGKLINCVVAFNMANNGYGVAGTGEVINNTISANTYAPFAVEVAAGTAFKHYKHWRKGDELPPQSPIEYDTQELDITGFYFAQTVTSTSQYAVFAAAMDLELNPTSQEVSLPGVDLSTLPDPSQNGATVGEYMNFTGSDILFKNGGQANYGLQKVGADFIYYASRANEPMTFVSWYGALAYSLWIGGTLPTEGQWELAARQNTDGSVNDFLYAGSNTLADVAWSSGSGSVKEVATKVANGIGLYDMSGNVWEWCADFINTTDHPGNYPDYTTSTAPYNTTTDPIWRTGSARVVRGGSWNVASGSLALAFRNDLPSSNMLVNRGFRPVLVP